ncbi:MAG: M1 family metallopeptidase [Ferruginibacter sp.]|nr:M1 family metallopeptidase [Ferruginibacter sp.]MBU9935317.1 M1 family metallopeptidase [Ferruginibacter sp.]
MRTVLSFVLLITAFGAAAQNLRSGGKLKPEQAIMDIRHYTVALDVDPEQKTINGYTEIDLNLSQATNMLLFDFWHGLTVSRVWVNGKTNSFTHGNDDLVKISLQQQLPVGKVNVKIAYGGKPGIAERAPWVGGFQWEKDSKGNPWIAVTCQGEGGKIYFPCKDHPSDEPNEGADMIITVPKGLVVAAPGLLQKVSTKKEKSTYHYKTNYTISNYCIVFNVARYKVVKRMYTTVNGNKVPMEYYVLEENLDKAEKLLDLYEQTCRIQEKYFGEYPWAKERIAASETPHLGMEHQTNIAYGNKYKYTQVGGKDFDWLLHHEFGHEWWANKVTNRDWAHMWIQEGICVFGDAMATRELAGEDAYLKRMQQTARATQNRLPVVRGEEVDSDSAYYSDIYGKGAFFMHTLRYVMGDEVFFPTLKKLATAPQYTYDNTVTTTDVEQLFSGAHGKSLKSLFQLFLYTTDKLEIHVRQTGDDKYLVKLLNMDMPLPVEIITDAGSKRMTIDKKGSIITSKTPIQVDPNVFYLKKLIME